MVDSSNDRDETVSRLFSALGLFNRSTRARAQEWHEGRDLGMTAVFTLGMLARCGEVRSGVLAERLGVGPSVISRQLADLAGRGLIERHRDPDDGRAELLTLTTAGKSALDQARREASANLAEHLGDWDDARVAQAAEILEALAEALNHPTDHTAGHKADHRTHASA